MTVTKKNKTIEFVVNFCSIFFFTAISGSLITSAGWCLKQYNDSKLVPVKGKILKRHDEKNQYEFVYSFEGDKYTRSDTTDRVLKEGDTTIIYVLRGNPKIAYLENTRKPDTIYLVYIVLSLLLIIFFLVTLIKYPEFFCFFGLLGNI